MKSKFTFLIFIQLILLKNVLFSAVIIPADNPYIQYYGRWDFSNPSAPTHSWPGIYIYAEFEGTSIGIRTNDNSCWYNVFIDDTLFSVFHGTKGGVNSYTLASGLHDGHHKILITLRGETSWTKFSFNGFVLDDGKSLIPPPAKPERKIEFIGDSFTSASGNEWTTAEAPPNDSYTNIYKGFGPIVARHFGAQYHMSSRGGIGLVLDWQQDYNNNMPSHFDRALFYNPTPKWDFSQYIPNLVVICLGLNDYNGWGGYSGTVETDNAVIFKQRYHEFISTIMDVYPAAKILAVAANDVAWIKKQVSEVVAEENAIGNKNVFYTYFPYYNGEYVNQGHPNLSAHQKIADVLIAAIDTIDAWTPYVDTIPPVFVNLPSEALFASSSEYALTIETNSYATVRYSTEDKPYDQMENEFTVTGQRNHTVTLLLNQNNQYKIFLRARDISGNTMDTSAVISFNVDTTKEISDWTSLAYDISGWKTGFAPLGSTGPLYNNTEISPVITGYFRHVLTLDSINNITDLRIRVKGQDGAIIYFNGETAGRINMDEDEAASYNSYASSPKELDDFIVINSSNGLDRLRKGNNVFAVEVHSRYSSSPKISFDALIFDKKNNIYADYTSDWTYYDNGNIPPSKIVDKLTGVDVGNENIISERISLYPNYPNPFNPETFITFDLNRVSNVELKIFNILGEELTTLVNNKLHPGKYHYKFDARNYASGIYLFQLRTETFNQVRKMVLAK